MLAPEVQLARDLVHRLHPRRAELPCPKVGDQPRGPGGQQRGVAIQGVERLLCPAAHPRPPVVHLQRPRVAEVPIGLREVEHRPAAVGVLREVGFEHLRVPAALVPRGTVRVLHAHLVGRDARRRPGPGVLCIRGPRPATPTAGPREAEGAGGTRNPRSPCGSCTPRLRDRARSPGQSPTSCRHRSPAANRPCLGPARTPRCGCDRSSPTGARGPQRRVPAVSPRCHRTIRCPRRPSHRRALRGASRRWRTRLSRWLRRRWSLLPLVPIMRVLSRRARTFSSAPTTRTSALKASRVCVAVGLREWPCTP